MIRRHRLCYRPMLHYFDLLCTSLIQQIHNKLWIKLIIVALKSYCCTSLWVKRPLSVSQQGRLSLPSLRGRLNE